MSKVAVVTGGAQRIGAHLVQRLHARDYACVLHYNTSGEQATEIVAELNAVRTNSALAIQADLSTASAVEQIVDATKTQFNRLDLLVNNASAYYPNDSATLDLAAWEHLLATNLRAPYQLSTLAVPLLKAATGAIINITDIYGTRPQAGYAIYSTTKAGLIGLTKAMARDLAPDIRVNAVSPGPILWADQDDGTHRLDVLEKTPLGRLGSPKDIGDAVCYLAETEYVTGQIIAVDGGRSIFT